MSMNPVVPVVLVAAEAAALVTAYTALNKRITELENEVSELKGDIGVVATHCKSSFSNQDVQISGLKTAITSLGKDLYTRKIPVVRERYPPEPPRAVVKNVEESSYEDSDYSSYEDSSFSYSEEEEIEEIKNEPRVLKQQSSKNKGSVAMSLSSSIPSEPPSMKEALERAKAMQERAENGQ